MKTRISHTLERVKERIYKTPERREEERYERFVDEAEEARTFEITVSPEIGVELRPFSADLQYSARTKTHIDQTTGQFVSKADYKVRLKNWRQDMASNYISRAHPEWGEVELVSALMRLDELRAFTEPDEWIDVEVGALFYP